VLRVLAVLVALVLALAAIGLLVALVDAAGLPRCEDREAVAESDADECIEGSSAEKAIGLALGGAAAAVAAFGALLGIGYVRAGRGGARLAACAVATPVLALGALLLLPISF
jgi:hypothetical protein